MPHHNPKFTLKKSFKEALRFLKSTKLKSLAHKKNLSESPWFLMLGPENSGKSTLLRHSESNFNLTPKTPDQHTQPNWWVTQDAIFLDFPGQFLAMQHNKLHHLMAKLIKKHAHQSNVKAIIIVLSLKDLLNNKQEEKNQAILEITQFINQLKHKSPIYLIINKMDLLAGFKTYFAHCSKDERQQSWGISLPENLNDSPAELVGLEFDDLIHRLNQQLITRLHQEPNAKKRAAIKDFTVQLTHIKKPLLEYMTKLHFHFSKHMTWEGVYFTADKNIQMKNTATHNSKALAINTGNSGKAYFSHNLLNSSIQQSTTKKAPNNVFSRWSNNSIIAAIVIAIAAIAVLLSISFSRDEENYQRLGFTLSELHDQLNHLQTNDIQSDFNTLQKLRDADAALNQNSALPHMLSRKNTDEKLDTDIKQTYVNAVSKILLPVLTHSLETVLTNANANPSLLYRAIKSYLMLSQPDHYDAQYFDATLSTIWQMNQLQQPQLQTKLLDKINQLMQASHPTLSINYNLLAQAQNNLTRLKPVDLANAILLSDMSPLKQLSLNLANNPEANVLFHFRNPGLGIPVAYTRPSLMKATPAAFKQAASIAINGNWVLNNTTVAKTTMNKLSIDLQQRYFTDYDHAWLAFINNISVKPITDINQLKKICANLGSNQSEIMQLLNLIKVNLQPETLANSTLSNFVRQINDQQGLTVMQQHFVALNQFLSHITTTQQLLTATQTRMQNQGQQDVISLLIQQSQQFQQPIRSWLLTIGDSAWDVMLHTSADIINQHWQEKIYPTYIDQLANLYPFVTTANNMASLTSITQFFSPTGLLTTFFDQNIKPFINTDKTPWTLKALNGKTLPVSNQSLAAFYSIEQIQQRLFPNNSPNLFVQTNLQATSFSNNVKQVNLNMGSQTDTLNPSALNQPIKLNWPDKQNASQLQLTFTDQNNQQQTLSFNNPWGIWQLMKQSHLQAGKQPNTWIGTIQNGEQTMAIQINTQTNRQPLDLSIFSSLRLPKTLMTPAL